MSTGCECSDLRPSSLYEMWDVSCESRKGFPIADATPCRQKGSSETMQPFPLSPDHLYSF